MPAFPAEFGMPVRVDLVSAAPRKSERFYRDLLGWEYAKDEGDVARRVARLHSRLPLLVFTPNPHVRSQLALTWGAETFLTRDVRTIDEMMTAVDESLLTMREYRRGDMMVVVAGSPPGNEGNTNLVHVHMLGEDVSAEA